MPLGRDRSRGRLHVEPRPALRGRALPEPSTAGTYFPDWLLERRKRAASALITVVADCYLASVSTHCMDKLVKTLGSTASRSLRSAGRQPSSTSMWNSSATGPQTWPDPFTFVSADAAQNRFFADLVSRGLAGFRPLSEGLRHHFQGLDPELHRCPARSNFSQQSPRTAARLRHRPNRESTTRDAGTRRRLHLTAESTVQPLPPRQTPP